MDDFEWGYGVGNWSFYEYESVRPGDTFYMVRCGEGKTGIVMKGVIVREAYASTDWSPKNRLNIHYADIYQNFTINSYAEEVELLTPDELTREIPGFDWYGGHSGRLLDAERAVKLDEIWDKYLVDHPNLLTDGLAFKNQTDYPD